MPPCQYDSGTFEHMTSGLTVTTTHSRPCHLAMQGTAGFVVSTQANSVALGLEDTKIHCMRRHH